MSNGYVYDARKRQMCQAVTCASLKTRTLREGGAVSGGTMCHMASVVKLDAGAIGRRAAARRGDLGLDQEGVATRAGMSRAYISRLENGSVTSMMCASPIWYLVSHPGQGRQRGHIQAPVTRMARGLVRAQTSFRNWSSKRPISLDDTLAAV